MKITFAANHGELGGGEVMLLAMAEIARDEGHDVTIVAPEIPGDLIDKAIELDVRAVGIHGAGTAAYLAGLRRWDAQEREGLLWCNGLRPATATAGHKNRVVHLHQVPVGKLKLAAAVAARGARKVVVPSQYMADAVGLGSEVLLNWSKPVAATRRVRSEDEPVRLGFIGRLSIDKGIDHLAAAVQRLNAGGGNYRLVLAGATRFVSQEQQDAVEAALDPISDVVDRLGWVSQEEFYSQVDLVVAPSAWDEPFGLVVTEAMSARMPIIVTDSGAIPSIVGHEYPWIAKKGSAMDLVRVIRLATKNPRPDLLEQNRERWQQLFSPEAARERFKRVLDELERTSS